MKNRYRDAAMEQISEADIGTVLRAAGWVENIRGHGWVSFVDIRGMHAVLQAVIRGCSLRRVLEWAAQGIWMCWENFWN